jgi:hypothetical protein
MADVWDVVHIIDRGSQIKLLQRHNSSPRRETCAVYGDIS